MDPLSTLALAVHFLGVFAYVIYRAVRAAVRDGVAYALAARDTSDAASEPQPRASKD